MNNAIFREKSIQKVQSPENLNEYIRVSNPGIWILLVSIAFLLLGLCIWGCFGQLRTVISVEATCENGVVSCVLPDDNAAGVQPEMPVTLGKQAGTVSRVSGNVCTIETEEPLADGSYTAEILVETIHPISFLLN